MRKQLVAYRYSIHKPTVWMARCPARYAGSAGPAFKTCWKSGDHVVVRQLKDSNCSQPSSQLSPTRSASVITCSFQGASEARFRLYQRRFLKLNQHFSIFSLASWYHSRVSFQKPKQKHSSKIERISTKNHAWNQPVANFRQIRKTDSAFCRIWGICILLMPRSLLFSHLVEVI